MKLKWLPPMGYVSARDDLVQNLKVMIMPAVSLALPLAAILMRYTRSSVLEALSSDHVRCRWYKGLSQQTVACRASTLCCAMPRSPSSPLLVSRSATLLGGTVIIERIFSLPGMRQLYRRWDQQS